MTKYVAAVAVTADVTDGTWCDVTVAECDDQGNMTDKTLVATRLPVPIWGQDPDPVDVARESVPDVLAAFGWGITGDWEHGDNAVYIEAVPTGEADDRITYEGESTMARLSRWVPRTVPDRRICMDGEDVVLMTGGDIYALLHKVADWAYHTGRTDVEQSRQSLTEFFGGVELGNHRRWYGGREQGS